MDLLFLLAIIFAVACLPFSGWKKWVSMVLVVSLILPFHDTNLLMLFYGVFSFVSVSSVVIFLHYALKSKLKSSIFTEDSLSILAWILLAFGAVLFLDISNIWRYSVYGLGYEATFVILFLVFIMLLGLLRKIEILLVFVIAWIGWLAGLGASDNAWDYVVDFPVFLWAAIFLIRRNLSRYLVRKQAVQTSSDIS